MAKKILVVDDEEDIRLLYREELSEEGYEVILASNGKEALEAFRNETPDLIVLDIKMPIMDGLEALGKIIRMERQVPVILNTAFHGYKDDFMSWAADAYIVKSADLSQLKGKISELLDRSGDER